MTDHEKQNPAQHLLALLQQEKGALEQNDLESLETIIVEKARALELSLIHI